MSDACLRMTGVELELLTERSKYTFIEDGMKGGLCVASSR